MICFHITHGLPSSVLGIDHSSKGECSKASLGYTFDNSISEALYALLFLRRTVATHLITNSHVSGLENTISRTLSAALVLHPIGMFYFATHIST
jgi:hypothetical protein